MRYTGNLSPLPTCRKMADLLGNTFGDEPGKRDINTAGQHVGLAPGSVMEPMVLLYRFTGDINLVPGTPRLLTATARIHF